MNQSNVKWGELGAVARVASRTQLPSNYSSVSLFLSSIEMGIAGDAFWVSLHLLISILVTILEVSKSDLFPKWQMQSIGILAQVASSRAHDSSFS